MPRAAGTGRRAPHAQETDMPSPHDSTAAAPVTPAAADDAGWVTARTAGGSFRTELRAGTHALVLDEPASVGGGGGGPSPYDLLVGAIAACTSMTLRMYAARKGWPLEAAVVRLRDAPPHAADCERCETEEVGVRRLEREVELVGPLTDEQRARLLTIADRCPVKQTLERGLRVAERAGRPR
jgi:putative redox protein